MRRIVRKDNSYRKKILSISLVLFLFMGIGYSVISSNLIFNGNIELSKYESPYLYDVLKFETLRGGLAQEYSSYHQDSMDASLSTEKIYHWYASNDTEGMEILNKNNVIFANQCWQMIRTTDTGGVKMIYNGEVENGQCLNTRGNHVGYGSRSVHNLTSSYWYGTDYTYDSASKRFIISGNTEQSVWNATTSSNLIGKYTCKNTIESASCSTLYLVESYYNSSSAYLISLNSNSHYSQFGMLKFNADLNSPAYVGYMYGDVYSNDIINNNNYEYVSGYTRIISNSMINPSVFYYGSNVTYSNGNYQVNNAVRLDTNPSGAIGKTVVMCSGTCTEGATVSSNTAFYIIDRIDDSHYYSKKLEGGKFQSNYKIYVGDSVVSNSNGYSLSGNVTSISLDSWYNNYNNYLNKYVCSDNTYSTCSTVRYIYSNDNQGYTFISYNGELNNNILIAKGRNGLTLTDTLVVNKNTWENDYNNYNDYKYTCNNTSGVCSESSLRYITSISSSGYSYVSNRYYGTSVTWDGTNYTLQNPIDVENYNNLTQLSTHHYFCLDSYGLKTCSSVGYMYYNTTAGKHSYISLKNGVVSPNEALNQMFMNEHNSLIKSGVDAWYKHYMLEYDDYLEDTIFCNDRKIITLNGWDPNGDFSTNLLVFREYNLRKIINCSNETDMFSVSNDQAKLTYKVGLMSGPEMNLLNNSNARISGQDYCLISPAYFSDSAGIRYGDYNGLVSRNGVHLSCGVRPAISLKPGTEFIYGNGSMEDPYVIKTKRECTYNGELTQGSEFTDGQYTYRYKQSFGNSNWWNIDDDGWGVTLTDKNSTDPVNTTLCTTINNKPIVSMTGMFENSQATSIDTSSFDTSNVTSMWKMFSDSQATTLDLRSFDTSKVTEMGSMFSDSLATSIDVSSFDTKNVENMNSMFNSSNATVLNLSNFDTRNVVFMNFMFEHCKATSIDVSSFNTKNVQEMNSMFNNSKVTSLDISSFDNSNVVSDNSMFCNVNRDIITSSSKFTFKDGMFNCPS